MCVPSGTHRLVRTEFTRLGPLVHVPAVEKNSTFTRTRQATLVPLTPRHCNFLFWFTVYHSRTPILLVYPLKDSKGVEFKFVTKLGY